MRAIFPVLSPLLIAVGHAADVIAERPTYSRGDYWILMDESGKSTKWSFLREEKDKYVFDKDGTEVAKDFSLMETGNLLEKGRFVDIRIHSNDRYRGKQDV